MPASTTQSPAGQTRKGTQHRSALQLQRATARMLGEVQWNVERSQKLHLDWMGQQWPTSVMDKEREDLIKQLSARVAMILEDVSAACLETNLNQTTISVLQQSLRDALSLLEAMQTLLRSPQ